jgi:FkbM family methyltransferase
VRTTRRLRNLAAHLRRVATDERLRSAAVTYGRLDYPKAPIYLRLTSRPEFHRLKSCEKEPWTVRWLEEHLEPGQVLYDVGANVGAYTLLAAVIAPDVRVVSFEPSPANFAALCDNLQLNAVAGRVTPIPLALGDRPRSIRIDSSATTAGTSPRFDSTQTPEAATALVDRLDDIVERFDLPTPDHLKLDVDGGELEVLDGAQRLLADGEIRSLMVELDRERGGAVVERLRTFGFDLVERASGHDRAPSMPTYGRFARG